MRIKIQQFLRQSYTHSWAVCGLNFADAFIKMGHNVELIPTDMDKKDLIPERLQKYVRSAATGIYDMQLSYTAPLNFATYLANGNKNRFGMWCYEFRGAKIGQTHMAILPANFITSYRYCDKFLSPSHFNEEIFKESKFPAEKISVIPHGINLADYDDKTKYPLKTQKRYKIALVIGQPHKRKNIAAAFEAFGRAFTKKDNVCLVAKVAASNYSNRQFEVNFKDIFQTFKNKFPNHAEVEFINTYVDNMIHLYNSIDSVFTMSNGEGFYLPGLEIIGAEKLNIAPKHGGQLDFLNENNSLLIDGDPVRAPKDYMYWYGSAYAEMFKPNVECAAKLLKDSYENYDSILAEKLPAIIETKNRLTWENAAKQILELCK